MAKTTVNSPSLAYKQAAPRWELPTALMGGTQAMVKAMQKFLPREEKESAKRYNARLARSVLLPAYAKTVRSLAGRPFSNPMNIKTSAADLVAMAEDVDLTGRNLTSFAHDVFWNAINDGVSFILVDYPQRPDGVTTLADERAAGLRPYFVMLDAGMVIEARGERVGGREQLERVRIRETSLVEDGDFGQREETKVRVWYPDRWELWHRVDQPAPGAKQRQDDEQAKWEVEERGKNTLGFIPLVACYTNRVDFMQGAPPLEDLAYLNRKHWQSQSDQDNILHYARVPILFGKGVKETEIEIGVTSVIVSDDPNGDLRWVEHQGTAIGAGRTDLEALEQQMAVLGYEPLVQREVARTATEASIERADVMSDLQAWVRNLEQGLEQAFEFAAQWLQMPEETEVDVTVGVDWELLAAQAGDLDTILKSRATGDITQKTFLNELKRRGILAAALDVEAEIAATEKEGAAMAALMKKAAPAVPPRNGNGNNRGTPAPPVQ